MSVSIDIYRSRIGQFGNSKIRYREKFNSSYKPKVKSRSTIVSVILAIATIIAISSIAPSGNYPHSSYYKPRNIHKTKPPIFLPYIPPPKVSSNEVAQIISQKFQHPVQPPAPANNSFLARYKFGNRGRKKN